jgi:threonine/homoserine/homoserine lactone efflux protein
MESLGAIFFGSFLIGFSGAAAPGPMLTVTIREAATRGFWAGPLVVLGHSILELLLLAAILLGLGTVLTKPLFFSVTGLVGGAILIWMGGSMLRGLPELSLKLSTDDKKSMHPTVGGIVTSLSNPYFPLWWATAGLALIANAAVKGLAGQGAFYVGHILADLVWYSIVSALIHFGRGLLTDTRYRVMMGVLATMLVGFGLYFAYGASDYFLHL